MISGLERVMAGTAYAADDIALAFGALFAAVWGFSAIYAWLTVPAGDRGRFYAYFVPAALGGVGVAFAANAVSFYLCFALMALPSWGLVAFDRTRRARRDGLVYLVVTVLGEALLLGALMLLAAEADGIGLAALRGALVESPQADLAFGLLVGAFALKLGSLGASGALPITYGGAPAGGAAALAGATVKVGVLGLVRLLPLGESAVPEWATVLVVWGFASAFGAAVLGVLTTRPRAVLGYSSASQMGLVTIALGAGLADAAAGSAAIAAAVAYSVHHGLAKATLFLGEDLVPRVERGRRHLVAWALALPAAALVGLPLTSGFVAKYALKNALHEVPGTLGQAAEALVPWTAVGTALLMVRFFDLLLREPSDAASRRGAAPAAVYGLMLALVAGATWLWPAGWAATAAKSAFDAGSMWAATWPALVALAVAAGAWALVRGRTRADGRDPFGLVVPGDALTLVARAFSRRLAGGEHASSPEPSSSPGPSEPEGPGGSVPADEARTEDAAVRVILGIESVATTWAVAAGVFVVVAIVLVVFAT